MNPVKFKRVLLFVKKMYVYHFFFIKIKLFTIIRKVPQYRLLLLLLLLLQYLNEFHEVYRIKNYTICV